MSRLARLLMVAAAVLAAAACGAGVASPPSASLPAPITQLSGQALDGGSISSAWLRAHPLLLIFWASWCGPCHDEQPRLNAAYARFAGRGVRFLGVDLLDSTSPARSFEQQMHVPYPSVVDANGSIAGGYHIPAAPALAFVDGAGRLRDTVLGGLEILSDRDLDTAIAALLPAT